MVLRTAPLREKIACLEETLGQALRGNVSEVPTLPARDIPVLHVRFHPKKPNISTREGQARLLHDLASIELQAMELGVRSLMEFPDADKDFREALADITLGEGRHLSLCLEGLEALGHKWGDWPVHTALWEATAPEDSLLDRILIVHRYLEGSGLDAGESILRRLGGIDAKVCAQVLDVIVREEVDHVAFGSNWYREECRRQKIEAGDDFSPRLFKLGRQLPRRMEPIAWDLRERAGFTKPEIEALLAFRTRELGPA